MNHKKSLRKLNRTSSHRGAMFSNMANSIIENEVIKTTLPKAKSLRPVVEKLVTLAKRGDLHSRRQLISALGGNNANVEKIISVLAKRYASRNGGYLRILKMGYRYGDAAPMAIIEFVDNQKEKAS